ncbi:glycerol-3-phosphate 1-O-acyltransferase PlsY [Sphingomonas sp. CFBP 13720]|uniref:glycerol-3-phosphate 1-O-acyltransferase PlsY n=1 Tax=Sphingomonas sp. CFBP 13720 TaxID=2775302 RepID=UPI00177AF870|nr:glycerol-3-phosphate 1-O-acyltransferase PlsY [Sphingomonas sp. CFBP 13720]MBD8678213.1 glycerol-3-phosphate 1-O-acyltransferase PlsY [Sphingomonas sp. CFBP 13720]
MQGAILPSDISSLPTVAAVLIGYLLGSVPWGILLTRVAGAGDLRTIGSGNIGATNVLRTGRKGLAAATLLLDLLKGAVAVWIAAALLPGHELAAGVAAFIGHCYPVWLRFRGGKGVATMMGVVVALHWESGLAYAVVWIGLLASLRISSVAGIAAAISAPIVAAWAGRFDLVLPFLGLAAVLVWKHRANIERLIAGREPKIGRPGA